jgi:hypothetical protein
VLIYTDVPAELGGRVMVCPEAQNASGRAIVDRLTQYDLLDAAIVQSFSRAELGPAIAAGADAMLVTATSDYDPAALRDRQLIFEGDAT